MRGGLFSNQQFIGTTQQFGGKWKVDVSVGDIFICNESVGGNSQYKEVRRVVSEKSLVEDGVRWGSNRWR